MEPIAPEHLSRKEKNKIYQKRWRESERGKEAQREWRRTAKGKTHARKASVGHRLKRKYGLTVAEYEQKSEDQGGVCWICNSPETTVQAGRVKKLAVDHNHETGQVRGLLCMKCNHFIGLAQEDTENLECAIEYLRHWNGINRE